jgi:ribulose-5-phosphate 4-epimerase/fuculose-1-phosphate aldolase
VSEYVKFAHEQLRAAVGPFEIAEFNMYRRKLLDLQLIGVHPNGVSYGNLSVRDGGTSDFYITGSATGDLLELTPADCAKVVAYDFERNWVAYQGSMVPSSESLTHAAIYECEPAARAVIHCHDPNFWTTILNRVPTTSNAAACGTPALAHEIIRLFQVGDVHTRKIIAMAGHEAGIITFGRDLDEAFSVLLRKRNQSTLRQRSFL